VRCESVGGVPRSRAVLCQTLCQTPTTQGMPEGGMAVWKNNACVRTVPAHGKGPMVPRPDGGQTHGGLRCLRLRHDNKLLLSAGADGQVMAWDVTSGDIRCELGVSSIAGGEQQSVASPQVARGWARSPCRHFKIQSCCCLGSVARIFFHLIINAHDLITCLSACGPPRIGVSGRRSSTAPSSTSAHIITFTRPSFAAPVQRPPPKHTPLLHGMR
jgi:WD40 repeat protein